MKGLAFLLLSVATLFPQGVVFQNKYLVNDNVLTDDVVLSQGAYVARPRIVVAGETLHWVRSGTLMRLNPEAWLEGGWVAVKGRRYIEDFWWVAGMDQVLFVENGSNRVPIALRLDDQGPELVVIPTPGGLFESNVLYLGEGGKVAVLAQDEKSGLDGVFVAFPPSSPGARIYGGPFSPPADAVQVEVAARDRVGNITEKKYALRRDTEPPEVVVRFRTPESNVVQTAADALAFMGSLFEFSLKSTDNTDRNPRVYLARGSNQVFAPAPEVIALKGGNGTHETFYYYAVDACGNASVPARLKVSYRPRGPVLSAH